MVQIKGQYTFNDFKQARQLHARQGAASYGMRIFLGLIAVLFYISLIVLELLGQQAGLLGRVNFLQQVGLLADFRVAVGLADADGHRNVGVHAPLL